MDSESDDFLDVLHRVPFEIWNKIAEFFPNINDLISATCTCKLLELCFSRNESLWKHMVVKCAESAEVPLALKIGFSSWKDFALTLSMPWKCQEHIKYSLRSKGSIMSTSPDIIDLYVYIIDPPGNVISDGSNKIMFFCDKIDGKLKIVGEYIGKVKDHEQDGFGRYRFENGEVYVGHWNQGVRKGTGQYYWKNGFMYKGKFNENQIDMEYDKGFIKYAPNEVENVYADFQRIFRY
jgi:hypothetical protein